MKLPQPVPKQACTKPGCAKDILWDVSGAWMWHWIKAPVCECCGQTVAVCPGAQASSPLARHHLPASLHPCHGYQKGSSRKSNTFLWVNKAKEHPAPWRQHLQTCLRYTKVWLCEHSLTREHQVQNPDRKLQQQGARCTWFFRFFKGLPSLPSQTIHLCLGHDSLVSTSGTKWWMKSSRAVDSAVAESSVPFSASL